MVCGHPPPDNTYLDDYVEPKGFDGWRERWRRQRREYVTGLDTELAPNVAAWVTAKRHGTPILAAGGELVDALGISGASMLVSFNDVVYDVAGVPWPPVRK